MNGVYRNDLASGSKALWLWALVGSLAVHFALMAAALSWKTEVRAKGRKVVPVEAVILTKVCPGPFGGHGGQPAPATQALPPASQPVQAAKPKPKPKPKPVVRKPVKKPEYREEIPDIPPPPTHPALSIPKPVPKPVPKPAYATSSLPSGSTTASTGGYCRTGSGSGSGSGGSGSGRGSGSGAGPGRGAGSGSGSLLQGYLRQIRSLLEHQKTYPVIAQRLNIQGVAVLQFTIAADGRLTGTSLCKSSGNDILDKAARETVRKVGRFPPLPAGLGRQQLTVEIPLAYRLRN
jgi:protein TonB